MKGGTLQINWHDTKPVLTLDFHPVSSILATGGADYDIKLWLIASEQGEKKVPSSTYQNSLSYHGSAVNAIRFSPSGELLASGADGGELIIWKMHNADSGQVWKVLKTLSFHRKDVLDLEWSADGAFLISGSVDNSCIIWDVHNAYKNGSVHQIIDGHFHYVQGVAWDPLNKYVASLSSDRTCRIYVNKPQNKAKGIEKLNYACQHVLSKTEPQAVEESKSAKNHIFHDETLPSFFRRLAWSPDGSFLLVPAGSYKLSPTSEPVNTAYVLSRKDLSRPALMLPGASKAVVAVRFCPKAFSLRGLGTSSSFKLPYRLVFAVATLNSLYVYDTEGVEPIAVLAGLHYAAITDIAWSPTAKFLALSSQDGYCTLVEFENDELGVPVSVSGKEQVPADENTIAVDLERTKEAKKEDEIVKIADIQEMETDEKKAESSLVNATEKQDVKQPSPSTVLPSKQTKKEDEVVKNVDFQKMETDERKGESSIVNPTEKQDVKQPSTGTVLPSKPAKRRITPMAID